MILAGHGVSLRVEAGTLPVRNGFTHYPQKQETYRYFKGDADLPPRIITLDGSGSVTFDVLTWLNEQKVPLVKIDWTGNAMTVISGDSFAANRDRVAWQAETRSNRRKRMEFCNALIAKKLEGCMLTMETSLRRSQACEAAMRRANADLARLANDPPQTLDKLRMLEAHASRVSHNPCFLMLPFGFAHARRRRPLSVGALARLSSSDGRSIARF